MEDEYSPVNQGRYDKARSWFDGVTGFIDGFSGATRGLRDVVDAGTDIRDDVTESNLMRQRAEMEQEEHEQSLFLERFKVERGDNVKLYWAFGAAALAAVLILR